MKSLVEFFQGNMVITEAAAKDVRKPRRGSTVYLLREGDTKAVKVSIVDINKDVMKRWDRSGKSYETEFFVTPNSYGVESYTVTTFGSCEYHEELVINTSVHDKDGYNKYLIGVTRESIEEYLKSRNAKKVANLNERIQKLEEELAALMKERDEAEIVINNGISESLQNNE